MLDLLLLLFHGIVVRSLEAFSDGLAIEWLSLGVAHVGILLLFFNFHRFIELLLLPSEWGASKGR